MERINIKRVLPIDIMSDIKEWAEEYSEGKPYELMLGQIIIGKKSNRENGGKLMEATNDELLVFRVITDSVVHVMDVPVDVIFSRQRKDRTAKCRQLIMFFLNRHTSLTHVKIGNLMGRDHSSISHALKTVRNEAEVDPAYAEEFTDISDRIKEGLTNNTES